MVSSLRVPLTVTERRNVISKRRSRDAIFPISFLEGELDRSKINSDRRGGEGREKNELLDENRGPSKSSMLRGQCPARLEGKNEVTQSPRAQGILLQSFYDIT